MRKHLRLLTWNIHACVGTDRNYHPHRTAQSIADIKPHIAGLQEMDWRRDRIEGKTQFDIIAETLNINAVPGPNIRDHQGDFGNALFTSLPVTDVRRIELAHKDREPRGAIDATLDADGSPIRVIVTHLGLLRSERRRQLDTLKHAINNPNLQHHHATILLGDLNEWRPAPWGNLNLTPHPFTTECRARTYPAKAPLLPLDRIYLTPNPATINISTTHPNCPKACSDHRPIIADTTWHVP